MNTLPTGAWSGKRVNSGKDRWAYIPKSQQAAAQTAQAVAAQSLVAQSAAALLGPMSTSQYSSGDDNGGSVQRDSWRGVAEQHTIDWEKTLAPLPPALALAVHSDSTRNMYIGNIEDFGTFSEDKLKRDFGEYGNGPVSLDDQELFQVPMDSTGAGIEIDRVGEVGSELVEIRQSHKACVGCIL
ncbi:hypothetical protein BC827DRAFT_1156473 [Russula dissimulans]|nr:hypothetical protein BC827DRAFT_1156473 [Russula dissimulans]